MTGGDEHIPPARQDELLEPTSTVSHLPRPVPLLVSRPRLLDRLDARTPLTILRGPVGFGKTTLVAQWVGSRRQPDELVAWVRLREGTDAAAFWAHAAQVAEDAGLSVPVAAAATGSADDLTRFERAVVTSPVPVVLVVDGLENSADAGIESDLLDLLRYAPLLRLVVCLRGLRQLLPHRCLDLETTEVGARDLQFTEDEAADFLNLAGVDAASPLAARWIVEECGGWPESVRTVVLRLREAPTTDTELSHVVRAFAAEHVHKSLLGDGPSSGLVELALVTSLPEEFTVELAEALTEDPATGAHLTRLDPEGLLTAELRAGQTVYSWPTAARHVLRDELQRRWPERLPELHRRLARWYFAEGVVGSALGHAVDAEDWQLAVEIIEECWASLIFRHEDELWRAITAMPAKVLLSSPRALAARDTQLPIPDDLFLSIADLPGTEEELAELGRGPQSLEVLETCFGVLVALRHRGDIPRARIYGDHALAVARAARAVNPEVTSLYPVLHLQVGLAHLLGGDLHAALPPLQHAYDRGGDDPLGYIEGDAAGKLALAHAMAGDLSQADHWVDRHRHNIHSGETWFEPHIAIGGIVAQLLVALDRLDLDKAEAAHDELATMTHRDELWSFAAHARGEFALTTGTAAEALDVLDRARLSYAGWHQPGSVSRPLMAAAEANLLLALGRAGLAQRVLADADATHPLLRVPLVRLALASGQNGRVLQLSHDDQWERVATPRHRIEMLLMRSVAAIRTGDVELAAVVLRSAVVASRSHDILRPFTTVPRDELLTLADEVAGLRDVLDRPSLTAVDDVFPTRVDLVELTERETQVLEQLATDLTIPEIASAAVLSYNTVRSQQRSLYKKLGTSDREEAVARARQLGLLSAL